MGASPDAAQARLSGRVVSLSVRFLEAVPVNSHMVLATQQVREGRSLLRGTVTARVHDRIVFMVGAVTTHLLQPGEDREGGPSRGSSAPFSNVYLLSL
jgi:acyl-CoA thioesterase